ncbi:MAG: class I SAM-dependent methyltransferase [Aggregatilineales bacterium]
MSLNTPAYQSTRQAWRTIWIGTEFDRELTSLDYARAQALFALYLPYLRRNEPILEAGCGPGHIVYYLRERDYDAIGLDYAPEALYATLVEYPDLPLIVGDVHTLPYATNSFGAYLSFGVVEHFEHGPLPALREAWRVLKPNGALVLTVPHPQLVESLYKVRERLTPSRTARAGYYERTYSHRELADHVRQAGFLIDRIEPIGHSYTFYGLLPIFRKAGGYYESTSLAEKVGAWSRRVLPWQTAFQTLIIAHKPSV